MSLTQYSRPHKPRPPNSQRVMIRTAASTFHQLWRNVCVHIGITTCTLYAHTVHYRECPDKLPRLQASTTNEMFQQLWTSDYPPNSRTSGKQIPKEFEQFRIIKKNFQSTRPFFASFKGFIFHCGRLLDGLLRWAFALTVECNKI